MDELQKAVDELEYHLRVLREAHGDALYELRSPNGDYIVTPILAALVNGRAKLAGVKL